MESKKIGAKITEARKKLNISQAQLSEQLFISAQAVGKWERGESLPDIIMLTRLAKIIGVDLNYFSDDFPSGVNKTPSDTVNIELAEILPTEKQITSNLKKRNKLSWNMSRGNWVDADFSGLKNLNDKFSSSNLQRCKFIGSDLSGLLLKGNNIDRCDFTNSDFRTSQIHGSNLANNNFTNCSLKETEFVGSHIRACDFTNVDFTGAQIKSGGIEKSIFDGVILNNTQFESSHLADIVFEGKIVDSSFENCAFMRVTFQNATLINTFFKCRSLKKIKFINCKTDRLTYEFLKSGKADLESVTIIEL